MAEVLTASQKAFYTENGYLVLEGRIPPDIIEAIRGEIRRFEEVARTMGESDGRLDLEDSHTPDEPRL